MLPDCHPVVTTYVLLWCKKKNNDYWNTGLHFYECGSAPFFFEDICLFTFVVRVNYTFQLRNTRNMYELVWCVSLNIFSQFNFSVKF